MGSKEITTQKNTRGLVKDSEICLQPLRLDLLIENGSNKFV